jgi:hypothetical protein
MPSDFRHAKLMQELRNSGATVEDLARAWASMDGKRDEFDAEKDVSVADVDGGYYLGYLCETEEVIKRATQYALDRRTADH